MKRVAQILGVKKDNLEAYKQLHANIWPGVAEMITECNIHNYSIYELNGVLFSYFEYTGDDYDGDMAKMAADPLTQQWWAVCKPLQVPDPNRPEGAWWWDAEEVFHQD